MTPIAEWTWKDATRVMIPVTRLAGNYEPIKISTPLLDGDISELKPGDKIRVAFKSKSMEWSKDEVHIGVVFMLIRLTDDEKE